MAKTRRITDGRIGNERVLKIVTLELVGEIAEGLTTVPGLLATGLFEGFEDAGGRRALQTVVIDMMHDGLLRRISHGVYERTSKGEKWLADRLPTPLRPTIAGGPKAKSKLSQMAADLEAQNNLISASAVASIREGIGRALDCASEAAQIEPAELAERPRVRDLLDASLVAIAEATDQPEPSLTVEARLGVLRSLFYSDTDPEAVVFHNAHLALLPALAHELGLQADALGVGVLWPRGFGFPPR